MRRGPGVGAIPDEAARTMRYAAGVPPDRSLLGECAELKRALEGYADLRSMRAAPEWPALRTRLTALLSTVRRHDPATPPRPAEDGDLVRAVHWNIEHGNRYDQIERALAGHIQLAGADLVSLNEVDLGMARAGNRDVGADLAAALGLHGAWAPLFLETTPGRDDDPQMAAGRENQESLFGLALLSRWPIGEVRIVELPSPERQFDHERMYGRHIALVAAIERPGAPFVAVSVHLEVHRTRAHRAHQMRVLLEALVNETRPIVLAGDFNSHTFDRGHWWSPLDGGGALILSPPGVLRRRLLHPDAGRHRETLFDELREADFEWQRFGDRQPTLSLRFDRLDEARGLLGAAGGLMRPLLALIQRRAGLRLDWFSGRGWRDGHGATVRGLHGPGLASDHAPLVAHFIG